MAAGFLFKCSKSFGHGSAGSFNITSLFAGFIGHFKASSQVEELHVGETVNQPQQHFYAPGQRYIFYFTACVNMQSADEQPGGLYQRQHLVYLLQRNTEFTLIMPGRYFNIAAAHDVGPQPDAYLIRMTESSGEFLQVRQAVDIDEHT